VGSGDRPLIQINAAAGNLDLLWTDAGTCNAFLRGGERGECVMYDQLGQGLSDPVDHVPTLEDRAADLGAVMDAAGFESATISAVFYGCLAVLVFAAQYPERVDGVVLLNPFAQGWRSGAFEELVGWEDAEQVEAYDRAWHEVFDHWGRGDALRLEIPALATRRNVLLWGLLERAAASPGMVRAIHQAASAADVREILPSVQARALVLRTPGHSIPEAAVRYMAELLPGASYELLEVAGSVGEFSGNYQRRIEQFMFGAARDVNPDRALMTVLFTDIVGSTERVALLGDARWREVLVAHERMLRREVESAGGRVVELIGDGSLSTFDGPARAIRCAERVSAAAADLDVEIRAGLHTGECEVIADGVAGVAVHIAARVSARARGGEVLVSRTVRDLVTGSGIALQPRREHELKGVPGSWELFAVGAETAPLPAPDQNRDLRPTDRFALLAARHTPGLLRAASRIGTRRGRR
jgi:class 3 adenylate cyclase/pimeloyl-ACP methyl ester carboxylesterase